MKTDAKTLLEQFEPLEKLFNDIKTARYPSLAEMTLLITRCTACVNRLSGTNSIYAKQLKEEAERKYPGSGLNMSYVQAVYGVTQALKSDISDRYLTTLREMIHADLFADLLETADYFLTEGYKDPAAVMIGGVLEEHLRQLCTKNSIALNFTNSHGEIKNKMGDTLNADLYKADVYGKAEQSQVVAWLALRNLAAHGKYGEYTQEQISLFLQGFRNFLTRYPA